jgi:hypothetical protein
MGYILGYKSQQGFRNPWSGYHLLFPRKQPGYVIDKAPGQQGHKAISSIGYDLKHQADTDHCRTSFLSPIVLHLVHNLIIIDDSSPRRDMLFSH